MVTQHQGERIFRRGTTVLVAVALTGCASVVDIAERHVDANLVQERVMNQQLLLNVVRASHRQPLHFSRIPYIKLPLVTSAPWELTFPFGVVGAYGRNSAKSSVGGALITVELVPQDSQEFIQGITTPVRLSLMDFFLQQGWPKQLVLYLFVEEMRALTTTVTCTAVIQDGKPTDECNKDIAKETKEQLRRIRNNPGDVKQLGEFAKAVDAMTECEMVILADPPKRGPRFAEPWAVSLAGLPEAMTANLVGHDGQSLALQIAPTSRLKLKQPNAGSSGGDCTFVNEGGSSATPLDLSASEEVDVKVLRTIMSKGGATAKPRLGSAESQGLKDPDKASFSSPIAVGSGKLETKSTTFELVTRSPDSMVYYLGEVMRGPGEVKVRRDAGGATRATLFAVKVEQAGLGSQPQDAAAWVDYWGQRYIVARPQVDATGAPTDRTMQALALVGQILQMQNKAPAPPRSATIRVEP